MKNAHKIEGTTVTYLQDLPDTISLFELIKNMGLSLDQSDIVYTYDSDTVECVVLVRETRRPIIALAIDETYVLKYNDIAVAIRDID